MHQFDSLLSMTASSDGVIYTRYADDITLSSTEKLKLDRYITIVKELLNDLQYPKLQLNTKKTVLASRASKRVVTGLVLTPTGEVSLGRDRKRKIRAMFHRYLQGHLASDELQILQGLLAFAESIEPGFRERLNRSMLNNQGKASGNFD